MTTISAQTILRDRDAFASQALVGLLCSRQFLSPDGLWTGNGAQPTADAAYLLADAMLKARAPAVQASAAAEANVMELAEWMSSCKGDNQEFASRSPSAQQILISFAHAAFEYFGTRVSNSSELDRLKAQNEQMRQALEPFALIASEGVVKQITGLVGITSSAEYFHAADAALKGDIHGN